MERGGKSERIDARKEGTKEKIVATLYSISQHRPEP